MNKDRVLILLSTVFALMMWIPLKLSKSYRHKIPLKIGLTTANNRQVVQDKIKLYPVEISGKGSKLFKIDNDFKSDTIFMPYLGAELIKDFSSSEILSYIRSIYGISEDVSIRPDLSRLTFLLDSIKTKVIPVNSTVTYSFATGYGQINDLKMVPEEISITGPHDALSHIHSISTQSMDIADISANQTFDVALVKPEVQAEISLSHNQISTIIEVDELVEKEVIIQLGEMMEDGKSWKLFPDRIIVTLSVPLSMLDQIHPEDIKSSLQKQGNQAVSVNINDVPKNVRYINHSPKILRYFEQPTDTLR